NVGEVRGKGLLVGVELVSDLQSKKPAANEKVGGIVRKCGELGVIIGRTTPVTPGQANIVIVAPPYVISDDEAALLVDTLVAGIESQFPRA
ncbi:MAG: aminotransferase class III-fold pyridoxal phosphate-dependent enzyme, partial [Myxococcales bacterium]